MIRRFGIPMRRAFIGAGYNVVLAGSAEEALEIIKSEAFPVIFLDLNLPKMNGLDLCREITKLYPTSIIHAVTGFASVYELVDCREAGFDDYFAKPVSLRALIKAASEAMEKYKRWKQGGVGQ